MKRWFRKNSKRWKEALSRQDWRCTLFPNGIWKGCCVSHDHSCADAWYHKSKEMRKKADSDLRNCANKIIPLLGEIINIGTRGIYNNYKKLRGLPEY